MTARTSPQRAAQDGFTLVEVLVVILIVGLLALIALPQFLAQGSKGKDAVAKHAVAAVAQQLEACYSAEEDYQLCDSASRLADADVPLGSGPGQVEAEATGARTYTVTAHSRSGNDFVIARPSSGNFQHTCTKPGANGCPSDGTW